MKTIIIFVIAVVVAEKVLGDGPGRGGQRCPINEQFEKCGTKCPLTCDNYRDPPNRCDKQCVPGCFCVKPYIRNKSEKCVLPSQCRITEFECKGHNEVYNNCGSLCPKTCANRRQNITNCPAVCKKGCFCARGYLRNSRNRCVLERDCD